MASRTLEHTPFHVSDQMTSFLIWLAMVDLTVDANSRALLQAQDYFQVSDHRAVFSVAPHTGHTDSLFMRQAIRELFPKELKHVLFLSAKDTWSSGFRNAVARLVIGQLYQFDRNASFSDSKKQLSDLSEHIHGSTHQPGKNIVVYPQGTRKLDAPLHHLPLMIAQQADVPLLLFSILGAAEVFPKVEKSQGTKQFAEVLLKRATHGKMHHRSVTVKLEAFLPPDLPRREAKKTFYTVHSAALPTTAKSGSSEPQS